MGRKSGLGKGLDALIPGSEGSAAEGVNFINIHLIQANPRQPRTHFDAEELADLAASIQEHGVIQPLIVSYDSINGNYTLIAGERRLLAAKQAGLDTVPAIVREASDQQRIELALVENLQRTDLNPLEAAEAYRQLSEDFSMSHEEISTRVGKNRVTITNTLRLLKLPENVKRSLAEASITEGHARALLSLSTPQSQSAALQTIITRDLTVRQTEELVRNLSGQKSPSKPKQAPLPEVADIEERLRSRLGTKVSLNPRQKGGGTLVIHYFSEEELETLISLLLKDS